MGSTRIELIGSIASAAFGAAFSSMVSAAVDRFLAPAPLSAWAVCVFCSAVAGLAGFDAGRRLSRRRGPRPSRRAMMGWSIEKAEAALKSSRAKGFLPAGKYVDMLIASTCRDEGVFEVTTIGYGGKQMVDTYALSDSWRAFLRKDGNLDELERLASK